MAGQQPFNEAGQPAHREGYTRALYSGQGAAADMLPPQAFGGFWIRLVSYIIDALILAVPMTLIRILVYGLFGIPFANTFTGDAAFVMQNQGVIALTNLIQLAVALAYYAWFTVNKGATPGKLVLGLRVVGEDCMTIGWGRAIGRYFAYVVSFCAVLVGFIMVGVHPKKRGLHDLICGTYVVKTTYLPSATVPAS
jgi:uncharacterized RDD family membrane protein YckC